MYSDFLEKNAQVSRIVWQCSCLCLPVLPAIMHIQVKSDHQY